MTMTRSGRNFSIILGIAFAGALAILTIGTREFPSIIPEIIKPDTLHVQVATSITKQKWLKAAAEAFAAKGETSTSGRPIAIDVTGVLSGDSMLAILDHRLKPAAWSPGEENWVNELNEILRRKTGQPAALAACRPTVYAPLGIAIWRPM